MKRSLAIALLFLAISTSAFAELYVGRVRLRGEIQNDAKPGSISFTYTGQLTGRATGGKANVSGGGLFRSVNDSIVNTVFTGKYTSYIRLPARLGQPSRLIKRVSNARIRTTRRFVIFPGGRVTLDRAINGAKDEPQRIRGRGTLRVRG